MRRRKRRRENIFLVLLCLFIMLCCGAGAIWAYSFLTTQEIENTFKESEVKVEVKETFSNDVKSNVSVMNTGKTTDPISPPVFVRVKLLPYWYEPNEDQIAGIQAWKPEFTPGTDWFLKDGYYYYKKSIAPGETTSNLISSITLKKDTNGNRQVLEIVAEGIQAIPEKAAKEAWGVTVTNGNIVQ